MRPVWIWLTLNAVAFMVIVTAGTLADPEHAAGVVGAFLWLIPCLASLFLMDD